jgi:hypothetical protein
MQIKRKLSVYLFTIIFFSHSSLLCGWYEKLNSYFAYVASNIAKHKETIVFGTVALATSYAAYSYYRGWKMRNSPRGAIETAVRKDADKYINKNLIINDKFFAGNNEFETYKITSERISIKINDKGSSYSIDVDPFYTCGFNKDNFKVRLGITYNINKDSALNNLSGDSFIERYPTGIQYKYVRYLFNTTDNRQGQIAYAIDSALHEIFKTAFLQWNNPNLKNFPENMVKRDNITDDLFQEPINGLSADMLREIEFKPTAILLRIPKEVVKKSGSDDKKQLLTNSSYLYIKINGPGDTVLVCDLFFRKDKSGSIDELKPFLEAAKVYRE